ncbi:hypothetical protein JW711_05125 [Candidatus Woesearchaeota archaeon]|nr:hypothetical protein [Candidatus Woesearchaeota archaeon]
MAVNNFEESPNPVLASTEYLVKDPEHVKIDDDAIVRVASQYASERLVIPDWRGPMFPEADNEDAARFLIVGNSINFCYNNLATNQKFATEGFGEGSRPMAGAFGMWTCLNRALQAGTPILDPDYLADLSVKEAAKIFKGNMRLPMLNERVVILNALGDYVSGVYSGDFFEMVALSDGRLYNCGKGFVERLTQIESFDDSYPVDGRNEAQRPIFDKRAQLAAGMIAGRFQNSSLVRFSDVDLLTVFADYEVPKGLRAEGIISYSSSLAEKVDSAVPIEEGSREELEIRASTVHAAYRLAQAINALRGPADQVNALHIDYRIFMAGKTNKDAKHHLTKTIRY